MSWHGKGQEPRLAPNVPPGSPAAPQAALAVTFAPPVSMWTKAGSQVGPLPLGTPPRTSPYPCILTPHILASRFGGGDGDSPIYQPSSSSAPAETQCSKYTESPSRGGEED